MAAKGSKLTIEQRHRISDATKAAWANGKLNMHCLIKAHEVVRGRKQTQAHISKRVEAHKRAWAEGRIKPRTRTAWASIICDFCGVIASQPIRQIRRTKHHFCSRQCFKNWCREHYKGSGNAFYGKRHTETTKALVGQKSRERKAILSALRAVFEKPNKQEQFLNDILSRYFPGQWEYTGDGKLIINGLIPDFTNCNGKKALIEMYGDYWHSPEVVDSWSRTELGRIMAYNSLGYRCLVIWEHELKDEQAVVAKVKQFMNRRA